LNDVADEEPAGANALLVKGDLSELQKAEAGVTCTSLIFNDESVTTNSHEGTAKTEGEHS
jgi:hypothetical protein